MTSRRAAEAIAAYNRAIARSPHLPADVDPAMPIRVECHAGYRGEQEPLALWLGDRRLAVRAVVDRWLAPGQRWFRVETNDANLYVLRHDEASGEWEIAAYRQGPA